jgi:predicted DNA-binding transcriptional regulator YafY
VRLRYQHGRNGSVRTYTLDPYGLVSKAGVWYLAADHRGEPHLFRADRILATTLLDSLARLRDGVELVDVWEDLRRQIENFPGQFPATVRVRREILGRFLLLHENDLAEPPPAAAQMLLAFGTDITVIDPPELRERLASVATAIAASYTVRRTCRLPASRHAMRIQIVNFC